LNGLIHQCPRVVAVIVLLLLSVAVMAERTSMSSFSAVVVGVADLDEALALWERDFGLEVIARQEGPDAGLARQWNISATDIARQALVRAPGVDVGMLHLIEWQDPEPPVREGAQAYDLVPKNLDVYTDDLPKRMDALRAAGRRFSNDNFSEVTAPNGITFREIHMPSHDRVNVVLLEMVGQTLPFSPAGVSGIALLITIVPDAEAEKAFYRDIFELDLLSDNILKGPEIEKMIGLPPGSALNVSIWGSPDNDFGRMELIEYQGARGKDLYPRAKPKALGILRVAYQAQDLPAFQQTLSANDIAFEKADDATTLFATGAMVSVISPAGMQIDVYQAPPQ